MKILILLSSFFLGLKANNNNTPTDPAQRLAQKISSKLSLFQALRSSGKINTFPNLDTINYGCFCRNLTRRSEENLIDWQANIGHPVDQIDGLCKSLINGWSCLKSSGVDISESYVSPSRGINTIEDTLVQCQESNPDNQGMANLCKIEEKFSNSIILLLFQGYSVSENPINDENDRKDICHPGSGRVQNNNFDFEGNGSGKIICCDTNPYPNKFVVVNQRQYCDSDIVVDDYQY